MANKLKETDGHTDGLPLVVLSAAVAAKNYSILGATFQVIAVNINCHITPPRVD